MRYSPQNYSAALIEETAKAKPTEHALLVKNFVAQIVKNGDWIAIDKILQQVVADLAKADGGKIVEVEFAREVDRKWAEELSEVFTKQDVVNIKTNPSLVAGVRITVNGEREFDNSLRGKLNRVFK